MSSSWATLPNDDLERVLEATESTFRELRGAHVFLTGGTGFVGSWLTETFCRANDRLRLGARLTILVRDPEQAPDRFRAASVAGDLQLMTGDVRDFTSPMHVDALINAATPTAGHARDGSDLINTIVDGARTMLAFAAQSGSIPLLFLSSGAVYGRQPPELEAIPETFSGAPDPLEAQSAYGEAKRLAELLHVSTREASMVRPKIARLFTFVGPYVPLDAHFAIGNFVRDAIAGGPIVVSGDGTPLRSYLYAADLAIWLWTLLVRALPGRAYNVGSPHVVSIIEAAYAAAQTARLAERDVDRRETPLPGLPPRYVPDVTRAATEVSLRQTVSLQEALERTLAWERARLNGISKAGAIA